MGRGRWEERDGERGIGREGWGGGDRERDGEREMRRVREDKGE